VKADAAGSVFAALADPTRRLLLETLAERGPSTVTDLAAIVPVTRQAVAKHLAQLTEAGLVSAQPPQGRRVPYALDPAALSEAQAYVARLATRWDRRLAALQRHLTRTTQDPPTPPAAPDPAA
jgi:DNA-binding transcriptional ArsR family regulator